jgi:hypothetical protein
MTLTYSPQEFAGQLSSYSAEEFTMNPMLVVCGMRSKQIANGAQALAIEMHDAIVSRYDKLTQELAAQ